MIDLALDPASLTLAGCSQGQRRQQSQRYKGRSYLGVSRHQHVIAIGDISLTGDRQISIYRRTPK